MLHKRYRKISGANAGHTYSVHAHGKSGKVHKWLLCRDSDVLDRRLVEEGELSDAARWQWIE